MLAQPEVCNLDTCHKPIPVPAATHVWPLCLGCTFDPVNVAHRGQLAMPHADSDDHDNPFLV
jgi:hypothetical protein